MVKENKISKKTKNIIALTLAFTLATTSAISNTVLVFADGDSTESSESTIEEVTTTVVELNEGVEVSAQVKNVDVKAQSINGHELVAENSNYKLFLKDENLSIIIQDKATGNIMESTVLEDDGVGKVKR